MTDRPALAALAGRLGVLPSYTDLEGRHHAITDAGREAIVAAMGYPADSEDAAVRSLEALLATEQARLVPATIVTVARSEGAAVPLQLGGDREREGAWEGEVIEEGGARRAVAGRFQADERGAALATLPADLPLGYHQLTVRAEGCEGSSFLVLTPDRCFPATAALGDRRAFGVWANLYSVRSRTDWGVGDLRDLRALAEWAAVQGADFIGTNPLHALFNRGDAVSPYSPVSRLYRNPLYLDVPAAATALGLGDTAGLVEALDGELTELRSADLIDYARVMELKRQVLGELYRRFRGPAGPAPLRHAFRDFVRRQGGALEDFAAFLALEEEIGRRQGATYWREWPAEYRRPDSPGVAEFRRDHAEAVEFHCWLQFLLDRQLAAASEAARTGGMALGLYQDLAVGSSGGGSDAWAFQELFRGGATIGAPPDYYAPEGQDWGMPPMDPHQMAASGFRYWIALIRQAMSHAGALRIDHAIGLRRLYWVPAGRSAREGAYVRYPEEALLGILALESHRARAVVVGEDLGTVPPGFEELLERWAVLSSRVLYFEREEGGGFRPSAGYPGRALATVTTHDHVPLAGFWEGRDLLIRHQLGETDETALQDRLRWRERERELLIERLQQEELGSPADLPGLAAGVHRLLARSAARLVGLSLDDLAGETEPVNLPGYGPDRYPVWSRRMRLPLDEIAAGPLAHAVLEAVRSERGRPTPVA